MGRNFVITTPCGHNDVSIPGVVDIQGTEGKCAVLPVWCPECDTVFLMSFANGRGRLWYGGGIDDAREIYLRLPGRVCEIRGANGCYPYKICYEEEIARVGERQARRLGADILSEEQAIREFIARGRTHE